MDYILGDGQDENRPHSSALDGIVTSYHHDEAGDEWVVRIHHPKGMQSVCGCPGEIEARLVASALAAVVAVADCTFSIRTGGGAKTEQVECNNLVEFDGMRDTTCQAIDLILDFIGRSICGGEI
ncbi:MAG TPA: hypothetical protein EYG03_19970 [Planctomycetes bacterium]|nr:hypothetical protein [Planctomycetota bacterium]